MSHRVDLFLFGENADPNLNRTEDFVRFHLGSKIPLKQATAKLLNDLVDQSESDISAFQQEGIPIATNNLKHAITRLDEQSDLAAVQIMHSPPDDPYDILGVSLQASPSWFGHLNRSRQFYFENPDRETSNLSPTSQFRFGTD
jgi:hypothetical protein